MGGASGTASRSCRMVVFCVTGFTPYTKNSLFYPLYLNIRPETSRRQKVATATRNWSKIQTAIWRSFKLLNKRNSRNIFQGLETMACLESGHVYNQTTYVCLCEKAKSGTMEMKRHNTIGDRVNIVFCPQTNVHKFSLSLVRVCATAGFWPGKMSSRGEGHLYPLFIAKTEIFNNQWLLYIPPSLTLYTLFPYGVTVGFVLFALWKNTMYLSDIKTGFEEAKMKVFLSNPWRRVGGIGD